MQFIATKFTALLSALVAFAPAAFNAKPTLAFNNDELNTADVGGSAGIVTYDEMMRMISIMDPSLLTFIGEPINPLVARNADTTTVTYCSNTFGNSCTGPCTVYTGAPTCLNTPRTNCLMATNNVFFCCGETCHPPCNMLSTCGVKLDGGFCYTPNTQTIQVLS